MEKTKLEQHMGMTDQECQQMFGISLADLYLESMKALIEFHHQGEFLDQKVDFSLLNK